MCHETGLSPPFQGSISFVDHLCFLCLTFVLPLCTSVYSYLMITEWERAGILAIVCGVSL